MIRQNVLRFLALVLTLALVGAGIISCTRNPQDEPDSKDSGAVSDTLPDASGSETKKPDSTRDPKPVVTREPEITDDPDVTDEPETFDPLQNPSIEPDDDTATDPF